MEPLYRVEIGARELCEAYPPRFGFPKKMAIYRLACPDGPQREGNVEVSRWPTRALPEIVLASACVVRAEPTVFQYGQADVATHWHVNFAHSQVFEFYGDELLAQDELQVLEHPALGSVREALLSRGLSNLTTEDDRPTPILVRGVERRCALDTNPGPGRPQGLYGNAFAAADARVVLEAVTVLHPPQRSNIIAMEAPAYGVGRYRLDEIRGIVQTAFAAFAAARAASTAGRPVIVHTGFWGCGAYGGDRTLMTALQLLSARLAGLDEMVYYTVGEAGMETYAEARSLLERVAPAGAEAALGDVLDSIARQGFAWGESDGN